MNGKLICPFCRGRGFDIISLKNHIAAKWCIPIGYSMIRVIKLGLFTVLASVSMWSMSYSYLYMQAYKIDKIGYRMLDLGTYYKQRMESEKRNRKGCGVYNAHCQLEIGIII